MTTGGNGAPRSTDLGAPQPGPPTPYTVVHRYTTDSYAAVHRGNCCHFVHCCLPYDVVHCCLPYVIYTSDSLWPNPVPGSLDRTVFGTPPAVRQSVHSWTTDSCAPLSTVWYFRPVWPKHRRWTTNRCTGVVHPRGTTDGVRRSYIPASSDRNNAPGRLIDAARDVRATTDRR